MAEQVVDIRERIERMRTQIDGVNERSLDENNTIKKNNYSEDNEKNKNEEAKKKFDELNKLKAVELRKIPSEDEKHIDTFNNAPLKKTKDESLSKKINETTTENSDQKFFDRVENFKTNENLKQKEQNTENVKKSIDNYQLKNTFDSQNNKIDIDTQPQKFPQFSLNINNPISWKLMLLIMLMQLLTNIMLVVVLYLK